MSATGIAVKGACQNQFWRSALDRRPHELAEPRRIAAFLAYRNIENPRAIWAHTSTHGIVVFAHRDWLTAFVVQELLENFPLTVNIRPEDHSLAIGGPCTRIIPSLVQGQALWSGDPRPLRRQIGNVHAALP